MHIPKFACVGMLALTLGACQQAGRSGVVDQAVLNPAPTFRTITRTHSPDPGKWAYQRINNRDQWQCRPLACADNGIVTVSVTRSPTPHPDPVALEKFAKTQLPEAFEKANANLVSVTGATRELKLVSTSTEKIRGYYAIRTIGDLSTEKGQFKTVSAMMFVDASLVMITSTAMNLSTARKNLDDFAKAMEIEDHPPE
jgi:hypothetical protein